MILASLIAAVLEKELADLTKDAREALASELHHAIEGWFQSRETPAEKIARRERERLEQEQAIKVACRCPACGASAFNVPGFICMTPGCRGHLIKETT